MSQHAIYAAPRLFHIDRQDTGRLGGVHDQRHTTAAAKRRHLFNGLDKAEHIGHMIADHNVHAGRDQLVKGPDRCLLIEQRSACYGHLGLKAIGGRVTALCSYPEITTRPPGGTKL